MTFTDNEISKGLPEIKEYIEKQVNIILNSNNTFESKIDSIIDLYFKFNDEFEKFYEEVSLESYKMIVESQNEIIQMFIDKSIKHFNVNIIPNRI